MNNRQPPSQCTSLCLIRVCQGVAFAAPSCSRGPLLPAWGSQTARMFLSEALAVCKAICVVGLYLQKAASFYADHRELVDDLRQCGINVNKDGGALVYVANKSATLQLVSRHILSPKRISLSPLLQAHLRILSLPSSCCVVHARPAVPAGPATPPSSLPVDVLSVLRAPLQS